MYGDSESGLVDETSAQKPQTAYAISKVIAEREILALADSTFSPLSFRFATAYGFSPRPRLDIVVNNLIASAISLGELVLESDGTPWRPLIHVKDMARAVAAGLDADPGALASRAFNVGCDEENFQVRDIARLVSGALGNCPLKVGVGGGADTRSYRVAFDKFSAVFPRGVPQERLAIALSDLVARFSASLDRHDYEAARFFRLRWIKELIDAGLVDTGLRWKGAHSNPRS
jgi:nucleoside-diphosphate-sugar epimerase